MCGWRNDYEQPLPHGRGSDWSCGRFNRSRDRGSGWTAEDRRVATFKSNDNVSASGEIDEQLVDGVLRKAFFTHAFSHVDQLGIGARDLQDLVADKRVVQNDVGRAQDADSLHGQQIGIAGACANEINLCRHAVTPWRLRSAEAFRRLNTSRLARRPRMRRRVSKSLPWLIKAARTLPNHSTQRSYSGPNCTSRSLRKRSASDGLSPAVEMAICSGPRSTT